MSRSAKFVVGVLLLLFVQLGLLDAARAQGGATGAISGQVTDSSGSSVADAEVQIISSATEAVVRKIPTGTDGSFVATLLPPGSYSVVVNKSGFSEAKADNIEVRVTETTKVAIALKPGAVSEKVEIVADVTNVETTNATTGQSIGSNAVRTLPLATQNFQQLLTLSAGAQSELNSSTGLGRGDVRIIVNGQREDNNNYLIEGVSATDYNVAELTNTPLPNPDVIQEFKVQTSLYDASQGRNGGGNVNAILKSGTRQLHGDAYEFFRNDALNANDYFLNAQGSPRPVLKQNIFGASLGGPVGTEKFGYFFVNYQGTRQRSGEAPGTFISTRIPAIPLDRSEASLISTFFPLGLPSGVTGLDPVSLALLNFKSNQFGGQSNGYLIPSVPDDGSGFGTFSYSSPGKFTDDQFTANWDREFNSGGDKLAVRFFFSNSSTFEPFGAGGLQASLGGAIAASDLNFPYTLPVNSRFLNFTETHLFSPTLVNEVRFGFNHINNSAINNDPVTASDLSIDRPTNNLTSSIYKFTLGSSGFQIGPTPQANTANEQNNYTFLDTVSWVHGSHVVRFGGEIDLVNLDKLFPQVFNGQLFFVNDLGAGSSADALTDWQRLLVGAPDFSFGGGGVYNHKYRQNDFALFVQDDWKATKNLTLNLGLRTEFMGAWTDGACHIGNVQSSLTLQNQDPLVYPACVNNLNIPGFTGTADNSTMKNRYSTGLGPRIGLAYDLFGHHTTTIRAGYGIYFVREDVGTVDQLSFQSPFLPIAFGGGGPGSLSTFFGTPPNALPPAGTLDPSYIPVYSHLQGFVDGNGNPTLDTTQTPVYDGSTVGLFMLEVPRNFKAPSTQQWNFTIQRSLGKSWVLEVGYVGTHAIHLRETRDAIQSLNATPTNPVIVTAAGGVQYAITANTFANAIARTPTPGLNGYSGYQLFANDAYSHYHSLQTTLSRRWGRGYFQAAYTWSKSTDATSTGNTAFNTAYNDQSNINASRGLSDFDRPHRLAVSYVYDLPFFAHSAGFKKAVLGGWAVSGVTIIQSGLPFSIYDSGAATAFLGAGSTPLLGASLASGGSIAAGYTHGNIHDRLNGYVDINNFTTAPQLYPTECASDSNFCTTGFGDLGRNIYRGPYQQNWDFSLIKNFRIGERQNVRFTTDFFNIWNHANFANPVSTDVENPSSFGFITSTKGVPRLIQFSLRYSF
ncbi:MAG TPA: carboxypeptidase-like regulatory domain-containing protein [Dongiaceae bacterium]|nr:carboxypeptidase-like regulatory domain-containing protein [Dongiaceae bacterium]